MFLPWHSGCTMGNVSTGYESKGYTVLRRLVAPEIVDFLSLYLAMRSRVGALTADGQVNGSSSVYGDPVFDALLVQLLPEVSTAASRQLLPTYSFVRVYKRGQDLAPHIDRPSCEHSLTLHLGSSDDSGWPIWLRGRRGDPESISLEPTDGVLYRGCDLEHWRKPCPSEWYAQAFLHFVEAGGPHSSYLFDRRPYLGLPDSTKGSQ